MPGDRIISNEAWRLAEANRELAARADRISRQSRRVWPVWWCCEECDRLIADYGRGDTAAGARQQVGHADGCANRVGLIALSSHP
jgi:hypothetical protein